MTGAIGMATQDSSARGHRRQGGDCCSCPEAAVRAVPARLLLLCLLLRSSWLTVEGDRHVGAAGVLHRRGRRAVVAVSVGVAVGVPREHRDGDIRVTWQFRGRSSSRAPSQVPRRGLSVWGRKMWSPWPPPSLWIWPLPVHWSVSSVTSAGATDSSGTLTAIDAAIACRRERHALAGAPRSSAPTRSAAHAAPRFR